MELKALLEDGEDRLRILFQELLQELLEQEMTRALAAAPGSFPVSSCRLRPVSLDGDSVLFLACLGKIVGGLSTQPKLGI